MRKKNKNNIAGNNGLFIIIILTFVILIDLLNGCGDDLNFRKEKLEQEITYIHSQQTEIYSRLGKYELIGYIEDQIKKRNLKFVRDTAHPKIIYIEKKKK